MLCIDVALCKLVLRILTRVVCFREKLRSDDYSLPLYPYRVILTSIANCLVHSAPIVIAITPLPMKNNEQVLNAAHVGCLSAEHRNCFSFLLTNLNGGEL